MSQAQTAAKVDVSSAPSAFNLMKWIAENPDKLKPPLGAKTLFQDQDFMVIGRRWTEHTHGLPMSIRPRNSSFSSREP